MELKKRIQNEVEIEINNRIKGEYVSAYLYYTIASWCGNKGLNEAKNKYRQYGDEEIKHARKLEDYLLDKNCMPTFYPIPVGENKYNSFLDVIAASYEHECYVTDMYKALALKLTAIKDPDTFAFIQWFITEQQEEEAKFGDVLVLANAAGIDANAKGVELLKLEDLLVK